MNDQQSLANNERLQKAFQALAADPSATKAQWEGLAMEYYVAGYLMNANVCFQRADAVVVVEVQEAVLA